MLLDVCELTTGYGIRQVLNHVSANLTEGEIVALIGHNGAGKSTLLRAIVRQLPIWGGDVRLDGKSLSLIRQHNIIDYGISYAPQQNKIFAALTVRENLLIAGSRIQDQSLHQRIEMVLQLFPLLRAKLRQRASTLSGGEKQMLAISNALMPKPRVLLLDEPSLGLAPQLVAATFDAIRRICGASGIAALVAEQKVRQVLGIANRACVLRGGEVSYFGPVDPLRNDAALRAVYF